MKLLEQLHRWRNHFRRQGSEPTFVPLTAEELTVVVSDCCLVGQSQRFTVGPPAAAEVFGMGVFSTPFAEDMRRRQIDMPVTQLEESADISWYHESVSSDICQKRNRHRLTAHICHDTTTLKLTFEWDPWASFKRKFRLTRFFPVRTRTVTIEGRVLYPYLKISLPCNKHHATFRLHPE